MKNSLAYNFEEVEEFNPLPSINEKYFKNAANDDAFNKDGLRSTEGMHEIDLTIPQMEFYDLQCKYPLFVAGFGSGKSITMAIGAVRDLINFPGADIGVYAPTYDLLKLIVVAYIAEMLEDGGYAYKYNGSEHIFYVPGYGRIICRSLDNPARIVGYETFRAHCDELDTLAEDKAKMSWEKVIARNRQKVFILDESGNKMPLLKKNGKQKKKNGKKLFQTYLNRVSAYTTPEGWRFAYKRWVRDKKDNDGYGHISASTYSNAHNLPDDYIESMRKSYSPELFDAYVNGIFTNLTSGRVYRNFHRKKNASIERVLADDILHVGMDFNVEHGAAVVHVERFNDDTGDKEYHAVDEIFDSFDTDDTIRILEERYPDHQIIIYPDASGKKRSSSSTAVNTKGIATHTDLHKLRQAGFKIVVNHSNPRIKDRVGALSTQILNANGERHYFVNEIKCPHYVETLEQQVWENGLPDKSSGLDHLGDAGGYCIVKLCPPIKFQGGFVRVNRGNE